MFPRQKANDHVSGFRGCFCYHISVLPCSRYVSSFFFSFLNPCPRSHDRDRFFRNFAFAKYQGEYNSKFYLILRSGCFVNGCVFTRVYVICKICEKLRRIHSCWCLLDLSEIRDKKEWVLVRREVLVSGLFTCSRSLETFYLASILEKIIATAASNVHVQASWGFWSLESV